MVRGPLRDALKSLGVLLGSLGVLLGSSWGLLPSLGGHLGCSWVILGASCHLLAPLRGHFGASWEPLGIILGQHMAKDICKTLLQGLLGALGAIVEPSW